LPGRLQGTRSLDRGGFTVLRECDEPTLNVEHQLRRCINVRYLGDQLNDVTSVFPAPLVDIAAATTTSNELSETGKAAAEPPVPGDSAWDY
jgi:hypothetical protein